MNEPEKKSDLGKSLTRILILVVINSLVMYYANYFKSLGGGFSEGFLVGWLYGVVFCLSIIILSLFVWLVYKNFILRWKNKE